MSDNSVVTRTLWQVLDAEWIDTDPTFDTLAMNLRANGKDFAVAVSGPKGMTSVDFIPAVRAAAAAMLNAVGGDVKDVGAEVIDQFYTGDQRAS
jgi:hypothetical protein